MYRLMIVDDEIWSVIGLKKIVEEDADRFELIYETTDPLDALEQICQQRPDIVFTDVRMPEMSGLELMRSVRQRGIRTEFVVISGFAEFSYVQQALQEGAIDYQLKPLDRNSARRMLDKVYEKMESRKSSSDLEFYSLLRDRKNTVPERLRSRFGRDLYDKLQIVLLYTKESDSPKIRIDAGPDSQTQTLRIGPRKYLYLINSAADQTQTVLAGLRSCEALIEQAAVSRVGDSVDLFEQLLKETEVTLLDSFVYPKEKIFRFRKSKRHLVVQIEQHISTLYDNKKYQQISGVLAGVCAEFEEKDMGAEDAVSFWNRAVLYANKMGNGGNALGYLDIYELTERFTDLQEMCEFLCSNFRCEEIERSGTVNEKFFEMLRYIEKNYARHLSLKELCNQFYINMSYCCELFQKHKNMTFSQYLTEVRINKACELLKIENITVSEACEMVGYKDYFYFSKVFKKKMGCTPAAFRKNDVTEQ